MMPWVLRRALDALVAFTARLPRSWVLRLGRWLGFLCFSVLRVRRRVTLDNIARALPLPPRERARLARRVYDHLCTGAIEFLGVGQMTIRDAEAILGSEGILRLSRLLELRRGLLVLTAHLGHWDLLACATARLGLPVNVVTRSFKNGALNDYWMAQRRACGVKLLPAAGSSLRIRAAIRRNEMVALVLDQHEPGGAITPFMGRPAATSTALARLARASRAPVVPVFLRRRGRGFQLIVQEPLTLRRSPSYRRDIQENTELFSLVLEQEIGQVPAQWLWLHRRWKVT